MNCFLFLLALLSQPAFAALTIYTDRPTARVQFVADRFTAQTGETVDIVELGYDSLLQKLELEGKESIADVIYVKDMVYLAELANKGLLQPLESAFVKGAVSAQMRDPNGLWTAITMRARTMVYSADTSRIDPLELSTYADLAKPKWAGRLCLRTSKGSYNQALVGSLIANTIYDDAKAVVEGWVKNMAVEPRANDIQVIEAIANGECDVGIVNNYYLGQVLAGKPNTPVKIFYANQNENGVHVNGTGAGIALTSKQADLATQFIELMLDAEVQKFLSDNSYEFPARQDVSGNELIESWGDFRIDTRSWSESGGNADLAKKIFLETGYL